MSASLTPSGTGVTLTGVAPTAGSTSRGLYRIVRDLVVGMWDAGWAHTDVPAYWRGLGPVPLPDPSSVTCFFDNQVDFGQEALVAFGGGPGANDRRLFGSVILRAFIARSVMDENAGLDLMHDAAAIYRSQRISNGDLSFIGGSAFDVSPTEDGNWFARGQAVVFQFRFQG